MSSTLVGLGFTLTVHYVNETHGTHLKQKCKKKLGKINE